METVITKERITKLRDHLASTKDEDWCVGEIEYENRRCFLGHTALDEGSPYYSPDVSMNQLYMSGGAKGTEMYELFFTLSREYGIHMCAVNNKSDVKFQQATPRLRSIAALDDVIEKLSNN